MSKVYHRWHCCKRRQFVTYSNYKYIKELIENVNSDVRMQDVMGLFKVAFDKVAENRTYCGLLIHRQNPIVCATKLTKWLNDGRRAILAKAQDQSKVR